MDIFVPMPEPTNRGMKNILLVVHYTLGTQQQRLYLIRKLKQWLKPCVQSDGSNFMSQIFSELHRMYGVKELESAPYHSETNAFSEKCDGTLKYML